MKTILKDDVTDTCATFILPKARIQYKHGVRYKQTANKQQHTDYEVEMVPNQTCTTIILYTFTSKAAMTVNYMDLSKYLNRGKCSQDDQSPIHFKIISKQSLYWDQKQQ